MIMKMMTDTRKLFKKRYRVERCVEFLNECNRANVFPRFCRITKKSIENAKLSPNQVRKNQKSILENELILKKTLLKSIVNEIDLLKVPEINLVKKKFYAEFDKIYQIENLKRKNKLEKLLKGKLSKFETIDVYNETSVTLPEDVLDLLKKGINQSYGGTPDPVFLLAEFNSFLEKWSSFARSVKVSELNILEFRSFVITKFTEMRSLNGNGKMLSPIHKFLKSNPDLMFCLVDKSKNISLVYKKDYIAKLNDEFSKTEIYQKLDKNPLLKECELYNKSIRSLKPYVSKSMMFKLRPIYKLKSSYGLIKRHKENRPIRPIVSSKFTITSILKIFC